MLLLPELLPRAGLDEEPPDEPVVEREPLPLWFSDEPPDLFDELPVDEPVVVRETVPLTLTPGRDCRPTTVALPLMALPARIVREHHDNARIPSVVSPPTHG